mgnify:CR=1 FL=1
MTDRTIYDNLSFVLKATGWTDKKLIDTRIHEVLAIVGLENTLYTMPHALSGGEQQRVTIARALLNKPELILADEPTGNLDSKTGIEIMDLLKKLNNEGVTIVVVTHNPEVSDYADRTIIVKDGNIQKGKMR